MLIFFNFIRLSAVIFYADPEAENAQKSSTHMHYLETHSQDSSNFFFDEICVAVFNISIISQFIVKEAKWKKHHR